MPSSSARDARPVRRCLSSWWKWSTACFMWVSTSLNTSFMFPPLRNARQARLCADRLCPDNRADPLAADDPPDVTRSHHVKDGDGNPIVPAQADGRRVHHLEVLLQDLLV